MPLFGLDRSRIRGTLTGPLTGIWFIFFVLPMFIFTPDYRRNYQFARRCARDGELRQTLGELPKQRSIAAFLSPT
jgi:UMF1 family MFS transporter